MTEYNVSGRKNGFASQVKSSEEAQIEQSESKSKPGRWKSFLDLFSEKKGEDGEKKGKGLFYAISRSLVALGVAFTMYHYFGANFAYKLCLPFWLEDLIVLAITLGTLALIGIFVDTKPRMGYAIIISIVIILFWSVARYFGNNNFDDHGQPLKWVNITTWEVSDRNRSEVIVSDKAIKLGDYSVKEYWLSPKDATYNIRLTKDIYDNVDIDKKRQAYFMSRFNKKISNLSEDRPDRPVDTVTVSLFLSPGIVKALPINDDECCKIINEKDLKITYVTKNGAKSMFYLRADDKNVSIPWKPVSCVSDAAQKVILKVWPYKKK